MLLLEVFPGQEGEHNALQHIMIIIITASSEGGKKSLNCGVHMDKNISANLTHTPILPFNHRLLPVAG